MCVGLPMRIVSRDDAVAICEAHGERARIDLALTGPLPAGAWILTHQGRALREISADEAAKTDAALAALAAVLAGEGGIDAYFADLVDREPELPAHLKDHA